MVWLHQALTHVALVNSARNLAHAGGPAEHRSKRVQTRPPEQPAGGAAGLRAVQAPAVAAPVQPAHLGTAAAPVQPAHLDTAAAPAGRRAAPARRR